jgi:phosphatidylserine/phosphatidylglycerophosphate/cardiolipin synthase-like enzyme
MHNKILIIDGSQVWFGSTNFTRDSLLLHANILIGVQSADLASSCQEKANAFMHKSKWRSPAITIQGKDGSTNGERGTTIHFFFLPDSAHALEKVIDSVATAQKTIRVAMYTFTHPRLIQALVEAHRRGVDVDIVMDYESAKQTSSKAFQRFKREKMNVSVSNRKGLLHYKLALIDDMLIAGSANWTKAAFTINDDNIAFISPLTAVQQAKLISMWQAIKRESKLSFSSRNSR